MKLSECATPKKKDTVSILGVPKPLSRNGNIPKKDMLNIKENKSVDEIGPGTSSKKPSYYSDSSPTARGCKARRIASGGKNLKAGGILSPEAAIKKCHRIDKYHPRARAHENCTVQRRNIA